MFWIGLNNTKPTAKFFPELFGEYAVGNDNDATIKGHQKVRSVPQFVCCCFFEIEDIVL